MKRSNKNNVCGDRNPATNVRLGKASGAPVFQVSVRKRRARERTDKKRLKLYDWNELSGLTFPGYFTVHFEYFATGEGFRRGLLVCSAYSRENLRELSIQAFGSFFADSAQIREGLEPLPAFLYLLPKYVQGLLKKFETDDEHPGAFAFTTQLYSDYS